MRSIKNTEKVTKPYYNWIIITVSIVVPVLVAFLFYAPASPVDMQIDLTFFPKFHASLNSITAVLLVLGFYFIKSGKVAAHKTCMILSIGLSTLFLISYVVYHSISESTSFGGEGFIRYIYYFILISHIFLSAIILPFILFTMLKALLSQFEKHKRIARWTLPIWLYVAVTGVLVYLFMAPYY